MEYFQLAASSWPREQQNNRILTSDVKCHTLSSASRLKT